PENFGRTSLAISPSDPDVIYAFAQNTLSDRSDLVLGVFRSANRGERWKEIGGRHFGAEGQISYGNTIAVHPEHPNHVLCGGVDLHLTTDGGETWTRATRWNSNCGSIHYAHADHHHLLMPPTAPGRVYDPNDGGLDVSEDGGLKWCNRSKGLAVTMYYDMDVAQSNGRHFGGGAQDNGTLVTTKGRSNDHFEVLAARAAVSGTAVPRRSPRRRRDRCDACRRRPAGRRVGMELPDARGPPRAGPDGLRGLEVAG